MAYDGKREDAIAGKRLNKEEETILNFCFYTRIQIIIMFRDFTLSVCWVLWAKTMEDSALCPEIYQVDIVFYAKCSKCVLLSKLTNTKVKPNSTSRRVFKTRNSTPQYGLDKFSLHLCRLVFWVSHHILPVSTHPVEFKQLCLVDC